MAYIVEQQPELLIHSIGPSTSTTFVDSSGKDTALTAVGSVAYSTSLKKWAQVSVNFPNTSSYLTAGPSSNLALGTGDFTIDYWIYIPYVDSSGPLHLYNASVGGGSSLYAYQSGTSAYGRFYVGGPSGGTLGSSTSQVNYNSFNHIAIVRKSGVTKLFINGYQKDSKADTSNYTATSWRIGKISCYMEEFRVTKGLAIWDANFTPPTMPYSVNDGIFTIYADISLPLDTTIVGIRSIDFYKGDTLLPVENLSCFDFSGGYTNAGLAFRTDLLKTGANYNNGYISAYDTARVVMWSMFEPLDFDKIVINNYHNSGSSTFYGARHIKISASPKVYTTNTYYGYGSTDPDATVLVDVDILQHVSSDIEDPQVIYDSGIRSIDGDIISPLSAVDCFVQSDSTPEDIDVDSSFDSLVPVVSGETVNSAYVPFVLLIQSESVDGSTEFYDVKNNIPVLAHGTARHSSTLNALTSPKFGVTAAIVDFDGSAWDSETHQEGYIETEPSDLIAFGDGDFTVDYWLNRLGRYEANQAIEFIKSSTGDVSCSFYAGLYGNNFRGASGGYLGLSSYLPKQHWYHIAVVRHDGVTKLYEDGVLLDSTTDTTYYDFDKIVIGGKASFCFEEFRVSKYARWTSDFTPPGVFPAPFFFSTSINCRPALISVAKNMAPDRTTVSGQPWFNQHHFNFSDPSTIGTGSSIGTFPILIEQGRSCIIRGKAYIFGGALTYKDDGGDDEFSTVGINSIYTADVDEYGVIGTWSLHSMTCPFIEFYLGQVFTTFNRVYLVGGEQWGAPHNSVYYSEVDEFGELGPWVYGETLKVGREQFGIITTRNKVYLLGGRIPSVLGYLYTPLCESAYIYPDGSLSSWEYEFLNLPASMHGFLAVNTGKKVYLIGEGNTMSTDVSPEGYVGLTWTDEGWTLPGAYNFVCTNNMLWIFCNSTTRYSVIASDGTIDEPTICDYGILVAPTMSSILATESKIYSIGGHKNTYTSFNNIYYWKQETLDTIMSADFSGESAGLMEYTQVFETTPLTMAAKYVAPGRSLHSYFGEWNFLDGGFDSFVPELSSSLLYNTPINASFEAPAPSAYGLFGISVSAGIESPVPEAHFYIVSSLAEAIIADIGAPLPKVSSYVKGQTLFLGKIKSKLPVVESVMSCPIVVLGDFKPIHPHINSSFQSITNIHSYVPTIAAMLSNPIVEYGDMQARVPVVQSSTMNPEIINGRFLTKSLVINSFLNNPIAINGRMFTQEPRVKSFVQLQAIANGDLNTTCSKINSLIINQEIIRSNFDTKEPKINSFINLSPIINGNITTQVPIINSKLNVDIHLKVEYTISVPIIHGKFLLSDDYDLIEYNRNRQCFLS